MTSTPSSTVAMSARKITCLAPPPTVISAWSNETPVRSSMRSTMASRNAGIPLTAVYLVRPEAIAATAADFTCSGVSKSGSPTVRSRISRPSSRSSRTRCAAATLGDSRMRSVRAAGMNDDMVTPGKKVRSARKERSEREEHLPRRRRVLGHRESLQRIVDTELVADHGFHSQPAVREGVEHSVDFVVEPERSDHLELAGDHQGQRRRLQSGRQQTQEDDPAATGGPADRGFES